MIQSRHTTLYIQGYLSLSSGKALLIITKVVVMINKRIMLPVIIKIL